MGSLTAYESWLRAELREELFEPDLEKKHDKMKKGAFPFLRATYWRWAETILEICPEFAGAPMLLAIGDTHLENFGTWRDVEGRLVWGANDFDDAAPMPYPLDLVRLAVSAALARKDESISVPTICEAIIGGYTKGTENPAPIILERDFEDLRRQLVLPEDDRNEFWSDLAELNPESPGAHPMYEAVLHDALPEGSDAMSQDGFAEPGTLPTICRRSAGTGSLGRPRFVASAKWKGGPVVREAKGLVMSAWFLAHRSEEQYEFFTDVIAKGRLRSPDPHFVVVDNVLVRRLSPNSRKIEVKDDRELLISKDTLDRMGFEIANCHSDDPSVIDAVKGDIARRDSEWLLRAVKDVAPIIEAEQEEFEANI